MVLVAAVAALMALWVLEYHAGGLPGQRQLFEHFQERTLGLSRSERSLESFAASAASPFVAAGTVGVLALLAGRRAGARAAAFVVACSAVVVAEAALNAVLGVSPPMRAVLPGSSANFPSGHVAYATAVFGCVALLARRAGQTDLVAVAVLLALLMGVARIVYGVHLLADVLAGYALGCAWLALATLAFFNLQTPPRCRP
jgi:undecaprenyl-diphosphatase